ncbi:hypothetical protein [Paenarthrobacter sp. Y-19]|jgi:hypothetical protein|uniref:hypothetical protein n=1 Tax=Paenarthrobacter sp. Y-19 TaxID=3031125 RepID=UPI0023D9A646|nr:hypothetical protein [Paenarthrobacter sp. Y-19]
MAITTHTPASLAAWESALAARTELCLSVAGIHRGKLTLYAGPHHTGRSPMAILDLPGTGTYISRPANGGIEHWIAGILEAAQSVTNRTPESRHVPAVLPTQLM